MSQLEPSPSTTSTFGQTWINWLAKVYRYFAVPGTAEPEKAVVLDANKDISGIRYISFGGQLAFPATQSASSNANTLDDYEEGTWTPTITDLTNNASSYSIQFGSYVKIANTVYIKVRVSTTNIGSVSGNVYISGLPFTSNAAANSQSAMSVGYAAGLSITAGYSLGANIPANVNHITLRLWDNSAGVTNLQHTEWTNSGECIISGFYNT